jgi:hypothetical protein
MASAPLLPRLCLAALVASLFVSGAAWALPGDLATRWPVNDDNPIASMPSPEERDKDPLEAGYFLQDLIARAEGAYKDEQWARSVKFYEAVATMVPERAIGFSRLCASYGQLGKYPIAAANCGKALGMEGVRAVDYLRFARYSLEKPELSARDADDVDAALTHLRGNFNRYTTPPAASSAAPGPSGAPLQPDTRSPAEIRTALFNQLLAKQFEGAAKAKESKEPETRPEDILLETEVLACRLGVRVRKAERVHACVERLRALGADPKLILPFEWSRALLRRDELGAKVLVDRARELGVRETSIQAMLLEEKKAFAPPAAKRPAWFWASAAVGAVLLVLALVGVVRLRRQSRQRVAGMSDAPSAGAL